MALRLRPPDHSRHRSVAYVLHAPSAEASSRFSTARLYARCTTRSYLPAQPWPVTMTKKAEQMRRYPSSEAGHLKNITFIHVVDGLMKA
jgi:hypothetical protein